MKDLVNDIVALDRVIRLLGRGEFEIAHHEVKDLLEAKKATLGNVKSEPSAIVKRMRKLNANT